MGQIFCCLFFELCIISKLMFILTNEHHCIFLHLPFCVLGCLNDGSWVYMSSHACLPASLIKC